LAFIPARSGSKGVKDKNIRLIKGIPLIEYTVAFACDAKNKGLFSDVFVSTDSEEYLSTVCDYDIVQGYLRPKEFARDTSPTIDAVLDGLQWLRNKLNKEYHYVAILQPTVPFRCVEDLEVAISMISKRKDITSVVGILRLDDHHPVRIKKLSDDGLLESFCAELHESEFSRRQDYSPPAFIRNGSLYLTSTEQIEREKKIRGSMVYGVEMKPSLSINIDEKLDLLKAQAALEFEEYYDELLFFRRLARLC
jgi:CMP-N-acetylneuraminic acid synthetase